MKQLEDVAFVEELIHRINEKANYYKGIDPYRLIEVLSALERIRLEHEFIPKQRKQRETKC